MSHEELLAQNELWETAIQKRDVAIAEDVLADGYALVLVHPSPSRVERSQWLAMLPDYVVHEWKVEERAIDIHGDVASVLQRVFMEATVMGIERNGTFIISDTWLRETGIWHVWRRHSSPLTAGAMPSSEG